MHVVKEGRTCHIPGSALAFEASTRRSSIQGRFEKLNSWVVDVMTDEVEMNEDSGGGMTVVRLKCDIFCR